MVTVYIYKLNRKQLGKLFTFLYSISEKVCFTTLHDYKVDEDLLVDMLDEYKRRCKEKHRDMLELFHNGDNTIRKLLKKYRISSEEAFKEYIDENYENEMALCKNMEQTTMELNKKEASRDYSKVINEISDLFLNVETHFFDQIKTSIYPLDIVTYKKDERIINKLLSLSSIDSVAFADKEYMVALINPAFIRDDSIFAAIEQESSFISMDITNEEYVEFKKLKIKHEKEEYEPNEE